MQAVQPLSLLQSVNLIHVQHLPIAVVECMQKEYKQQPFKIASFTSVQQKQGLTLVVGELSSATFSILSLLNLQLSSHVNPATMPVAFQQCTVLCGRKHVFLIVLLSDAVPLLQQTTMQVVCLCGDVMLRLAVRISSLQTLALNDVEDVHHIIFILTSVTIPLFISFSFVSSKTVVQKTIQEMMHIFMIGNQQNRFSIAFL